MEYWCIQSRDCATIQLYLFFRGGAVALGGPWGVGHEAVALSQVSDTHNHPPPACLHLGEEHQLL